MVEIFFVVSKAFKSYGKKIKHVFALNNYVKFLIDNDNFIFESTGYRNKTVETSNSISEKSEIVNKKYLSLIDSLSDSLNNIHSRNYNSLYWKQSVSLGLIKYISLCYDFFESIELSFNKREHVCYILNKKSFIQIDDFEHLRDTLESSIGQEILFSIYIQLFYTDSIKGEFNYSVSSDKKKNLLIEFLRKIKKVIKNFQNILERKKIRIGVLGSYFDKKYLNELSFTTNNKIAEINIDEPNINSKIDFNIRKTFIKFFKSNDRFDIFLIETFKYLFPKTHIENYISYEKFIIKKINNYTSLKYIISENWISHTFNSMIISQLKIKGIIHYFNEHNCLFHPYVGHQINHIVNLCDYYLTIGWKNYSNKKFISIGSLFDFKTKKNKNPKFKILYLSALLIPYRAIYTGAYGYVSSGVEDCISFEKTFFKRLNSDTIGMIYHRPYPRRKKIGYDIYDEKIIMNDEYSKLKKTNPNENFNSIISNSELIVCNYVSTTYLQGIISDIPTVLMVPSSYYLNKKYVNFFDYLIEGKIAFNDPVECANHVNTISKNPKKWWYSEKVRTCRKKFLKENLMEPKDALSFYKNLCA